MRWFNDDLRDVEGWWGFSEEEAIRGELPRHGEQDDDGIE